jgi:ketosteroid isomerase-like protein
MLIRWLLVGVIVAACTTTPGPPVDPEVLAKEVENTERAFAKTLADRNLSTFTSFLSHEAVFFDGETPTRGKDAIGAKWKPYFDGAQAPFSWEPDHVEVLKSGSLALSTGPVRDAEGKVIGRFNSIWRREAPGEWKVVFDKGCPVCAVPAK